MDARPHLERIAHALRVSRLEAVMIGNAAAALHGAPVTTLDFDFMFRKTPMNLRKLKVFARELGATVFQPFYPLSAMYRVINEDTGLQVDFMSVLHGLRSFEAVRSRAQLIDFAGHSLTIADLRDIIKSKRAANRAKDRAVLEILEIAHREQKAEKSKPDRA